MRPVQLTLRGFMPFREEVEIDFTDLQLFAIQGATGSGKSSLLDAITYALYGETDRLGQTGLDALISTGEKSFAVSLTFESGGQMYRVSRTKGRKQAENQVRIEQAAEGGGERRWLNLSDNTTRATQNRISRLLGLDFRSFTRAVMLPQGKFDALLRGSKAERQKLLGELTNIGHVAEMHAHASERAKTLKFELAGVHHLLEGEYAGVSQEALLELRAERERCESEAQTLGDDRDALQAELTRLRAQESLHREFEAAGHRLASLDAQAADLHLGAQRAERARSVAGALPLLGAAQEAQAAAQRAGEDARQAASALAAANAALVGAAGRERAALEAQTSGAEQASEQLERAERVAQARPLLTASAQTGQLRQRAEYGVLAAQTALKQAELQQAAAERAEQAAAEQAGRIPDLEARAELLKNAEADLARLKRAGGNVQTSHPDPLPWDEDAHHAAREAAHKLEQLRAEKIKLESEKAGLSAGRARHTESEQLQRQELAEMEQLTQDGRILKAELDRAEAELAAAREQAGLSAYRAHLHLGQPCPLCEQTVRTLPGGPLADVTALEAAAAATRQRLEERRDRFKNLRASTTVRARQLEDKARELADWEAALSDRESDVRLGEAKYSGDEPQRALRLLAGLARRVQLAGRDPAGERQRVLAEIAELRAGLDAARSARSQAGAVVAAAQATHQAARQTLSERAAEAERAEAALQNALATLQLSAEQVQAAGDPAEARRAAQQRLRELAAEVETARQVQAQAQALQAAAAARAQAAGQRAEERQAEAERASSALQAVLGVLKLSAEEVQRAALDEEEIRRLEAAWRRHLAEREQLLAERAALQAKLGGAAFDPARLTQAQRDLYAAEAALTAARGRIGELSESLRAGAERLQRKTELQAQAGRLSGAVDLWTTLTNSLRANEFQQYLLQDVESRLLAGAGELLHDISDGRYRLALDGGDYVVQDLWNAGETRGVKTLSGGETFLASLSLAIALSDYLAGNRILGALFLDEGFGTLDPQALESVAGALENLRTQGRMVGVITHVESLSERLPSRLLVSKSVAGSSVQRLDA
ncbi:chromosome segregation protein SMC [Deinococcus irradiatisoli]|uniref:Chromosome segregation protein SMC n=1 Tax=Deinococcus irradiatisoli TaxID=2202254 RepID=A0A2Z3JFE5_9DEIO|nr:SMC family ATPase [Deinococcus irradiatisoli]AWN23695.1 chromosome segregation protein SMC [Deinococcus irradiatisoli]